MEEAVLARRPQLGTQRPQPVRLRWKKKLANALGGRVQKEQQICVLVK